MDLTCVFLFFGQFEVFHVYLSTDSGNGIVTNGGSNSRIHAGNQCWNGKRNQNSDSGFTSCWILSSWAPFCGESFSDACDEFIGSQLFSTCLESTKALVTFRALCKRAEVSTHKIFLGVVVSRPQKHSNFGPEVGKLSNTFFSIVNLGTDISEKDFDLGGDGLLRSEVCSGSVDNCNASFASGFSSAESHKSGQGKNELHDFR